MIADPLCFRRWSRNTSGPEQPVSSRAVLQRCSVDVSSATIRNDLAKLESYGFVTQPHTSAGRVPTPAGYRYYVDHCSPTRLRTATRERIESFFADFHEELSKLLRQTSGLLSEISHYPAVVMGPGFGEEIVRALASRPPRWPCGPGGHHRCNRSGGPGYRQASLPPHGYRAR